MPSAKVQEIYDFVLPEMEANDIEDTTLNRYLFLTGVRDAWYEDEESSFEKTLYLIAINGEIMILKIRLAQAGINPTE